jgi:hypothetical protein
MDRRRTGLPASRRTGTFTTGVIPRPRQLGGAFFYGVVVTVVLVAGCAGVVVVTEVDGAAATHPAKPRPSSDSISA